VFVDLVLSKNPDLSIKNYHYADFEYLISEELPWSELASGDAIARSGESAIEFTFDTYIDEGKYHFYLAVSAIDNDTGGFVEETDDEDNLQSSATDTVTFGANELPNLAVAFWFADWNREAEDGWLEYYIVNDSNTVVEADQDWEISLVLRTDRDAMGNKLAEPVEYTVWRETVYEAFWPLEEEQEPETQDYPFYLQGGDERGWFTIFEDVDGNTIPSGRYSVELFLDGGKRPGENNKIKEFDEADNTSRAGLFVTVLSKDGGTILPKPGEFEGPKPTDGTEPPPVDDTEEPPPVDGAKEPQPVDGTGEPQPVDGAGESTPTGSNIVPPPTGGTAPPPVRRRGGNDVVRAYNCHPRFFAKCAKPVPQSRRRQTVDNVKVYAKTIRSRSKVIFPLQRIMLLSPVQK